MGSWIRVGSRKNSKKLKKRAELQDKFYHCFIALFGASLDLFPKLVRWGSSSHPQGFIQFSSVTQSCPTPCDPMDCSMPGIPVHHQLPEFTQTQVHWVGDAIQPSHPLLLPPSIFPSIRIFSNKSVLHIRWPKYWSFSFNISPSNEHPGLISFRID